MAASLIQPAYSPMWIGHKRPICFRHRFVKVKMNGRCWACKQQERQVELYLADQLEFERNTKWRWFLR